MCLLCTFLHNKYGSQLQIKFAYLIGKCILFYWWVRHESYDVSYLMPVQYTVWFWKRFRTKRCIIQLIRLVRFAHLLVCMFDALACLLDWLTDCMHASRQTATQLMIGDDFKVNELRNRNERVFNKKSIRKMCRLDSMTNFVSPLSVWVQSANDNSSTQVNIILDLVTNNHTYWKWIETDRGSPTTDRIK